MKLLEFSGRENYILRTNVSEHKMAATSKYLISRHKKYALEYYSFKQN